MKISKVNTKKNYYILLKNNPIVPKSNNRFTGCTIYNLFSATEAVSILDLKIIIEHDN